MAFARLKLALYLHSYERCYYNWCRTYWFGLWYSG